MRTAARRRVGVIVTLCLVAAAGLACVVIWDHYLTAPWTRDGQVQGYVVGLAPQVSGRILRVAVADNQDVRKDQLLYEIDPVDFQISVAAAEANVESRRADMDAKQRQATRRQQLSTLSTSEEEQQNFVAASEVARAAYATAISQLNQARINLDRAQVKSPVTARSPTCSCRRATTPRSGGGTSRC